jgi:hypothetical protein
VAVTSVEATRTDYGSALDELWGDTSPAVAQLERIASAPEDGLDGCIDLLPALQYALHRASEAAVGLRPPPGTAGAHAEFAAALADARDVTGDVSELASHYDYAAAHDLAHEWRAALFRVRLARRRLTRSRPLPEVEREETASSLHAALSLAVLVAGTGFFVAGAVLGLWPVWAIGLALVAAASLVYRA